MDHSLQPRLVGKRRRFLGPANSKPTSSAIVDSLCVELRARLYVRVREIPSHLHRRDRHTDKCLFSNREATSRPIENAAGRTILSSIDYASQSTEIAAHGRTRRLGPENRRNHRRTELALRGSLVGAASTVMRHLSSPTVGTRRASSARSAAPPRQTRVAELTYLRARGERGRDGAGTVPARVTRPGTPPPAGQWRRCQRRQRRQRSRRQNVTAERDHRRAPTLARHTDNTRHLILVTSSDTRDVIRYS